MFLEGVADQADDAVKRATRLLELRDDYQQRLYRTRRSAAPLRLLDEIFTRSALTIPRAREILGVTPAWASKAVERLEEAGIVREITGRERYRIYIAWEVLNVLEMDLRGDDSSGGEPAVAGHGSDRR